MSRNRIGMGWQFWAFITVVAMGMASGAWAQQAPATAKSAEQEKAAASEPQWSNSLLPGQVNMGIHFGDQQTESFGDMLVPILSSKTGLLFVNPRGTWNDADGQEFNLGLGYRQLFPEKNIILGANVFYDLRNTELDNTFNQFGCGVEFLSKWVDARMNVYLPEHGKKAADQYEVTDGTMQQYNDYWYAPTGQGHLITQYGYEATDTFSTKTLQHYRMYEQAMDGFDGEIGALLPLPVIQDWADVKAFVGYYDYNAHYGDDISGMKGRLEIRPMPALYLDAAWFEDKDLIGSHYSVGARASLPFDLANLSRGKNPFAGALDGFKPGTKKPDFSSRMTEMVVRDLHVRTDVSKPEEVVADRRLLSKTLISTDRHDYNLTLASDVTFVDDDNRSGVENGTWEYPYRKINTGVQNVIGQMVYVRDAAQQYYENVILKDGLVLWGSGAPIYGRGGRFLGGIAPIVNGGQTGPAITLANHVEVAGFEIFNPVLDIKLRDGFSGIYGENVTGVNIHDNYIHGPGCGSGFTGPGIVLEEYNMASVEAMIANNRITALGGDGIDIYLNNVPEVDLVINKNTVAGNEGAGLHIEATGNSGGFFMSRVSGDFINNDEDGVSLQASGYDTAVALFLDTATDNNQWNGINVDLFGVGFGAAVIASSADLNRTLQVGDTVLNSVGLPLGLASLADSEFGLSGLAGIHGARANGNGDCGISASIKADRVSLAALVGVQADANGMGRDKPLFMPTAGISVSQNAPDAISAFVRCYANDNRGSGIAVESAGSSFAVNAFVDIHANRNTFGGIMSDVSSSDGFAGTVILASDPLLSLLGNLSQQPALVEALPIDIQPMDFHYVPSFGQNQMNQNGLCGIFIRADGYDAAFGVVLDAQANGNGFSKFKGERLAGGVRMDLNSANGDAIGVVASTESILKMAQAMIDAKAPGALDLSGVATLGQMEANGNNGPGVSIDAHARNDVIVGVMGVDALDNGTDKGKNGFFGDGVEIYGSSSYEDVTVGLADITASGNSGDGISVNASAADDACLSGFNLTAENNHWSGLELDVGHGDEGLAEAVLAGVSANKNGARGWIFTSTRMIPPSPH